MSILLNAMCVDLIQDRNFLERVIRSY